MIEILVHGWSGSERARMADLGYVPATARGLAYQSVMADHPMDVARRIYDGGLAVAVKQLKSGKVIVFVDTFDGGFRTR